MAAVNLVTQAEYAKLRGVSPVAVHKAVKAGRITLIDGKIDPVVANVQWEANTRKRVDTAAAPAQPELLAAASAGGQAPAAQVAESGDGYNVSRARIAAAEAEMAELRLAEEQGKTIRVDAIRQALATAFAGTRDALMQIPARLSAVLAAEPNPAKVHDLLEAELHTALAQLATLRERVAPVQEEGAT